MVKISLQLLDNTNNPFNLYDLSLKKLNYLIVEKHLLFTFVHLQHILNLNNKCPHIISYATTKNLH